MLKHVIVEAGKTRKKRKPIRFMFMMKGEEILGYVLARSKNHFEYFVTTENGYEQVKGGSIGWHVQDMCTRKGLTQQDVYNYFGVTRFSMLIWACKQELRD